jgi:hypothetical protein
MPHGDSIHSVLDAYNNIVVSHMETVFMAFACSSDLVLVKYTGLDSLMRLALRYFYSSCRII